MRVLGSRDSAMWVSGAYKRTSGYEVSLVANELSGVRHDPQAQEGRGLGWLIGPCQKAHGLRQLASCTAVEAFPNDSPRAMEASRDNHTSVFDAGYHITCYQRLAGIPVLSVLLSGAHPLRVH